MFQLFVAYVMIIAAAYKSQYQPAIQFPVNIGLLAPPPLGNAEMHAINGNIVSFFRRGLGFAIAIIMAIWVITYLIQLLTFGRIRSFHLFRPMLLTTANQTLRTRDRFAMLGRRLPLITALSILFMLASPFIFLLYLLAEIVVVVMISFRINRPSIVVANMRQRSSTNRPSFRRRVQEGDEMVANPNSEAVRTPSPDGQDPSDAPIELTPQVEEGSSDDEGTIRGPPSVETSPSLQPKGGPQSAGSFLRSLAKQQSSQD